MAKNNENSEGEEDVDQCFLDQVLNQLYDFGKFCSECSRVLSVSYLAFP